MPFTGHTISIGAAYGWLPNNPSTALKSQQAGRFAIFHAVVNAARAQPFSNALQRCRSAIQTVLRDIAQHSGGDRHIRIARRNLRADVG